MDLSHWFHQQLQTSTEGFLWAVEQIPPERLYLEPRPGKWPVARLLFHMASYDRAIGLPALRQWVGMLLPEMQFLYRYRNMSCST